MRVGFPEDEKSPQFTQKVEYHTGHMRVEFAEDENSPQLLKD